MVNTGPLSQRRGAFCVRFKHLRLDNLDEKRYHKDNRIVCRGEVSPFWRTPMQALGRSTA